MYLIVYLLLINMISLAAFAIDKHKAVSHRWRIRESTLIGLCVIGGSIGGLAGMHLFHHKTKKPLFFIGIPLILTAQAAASVTVYMLLASNAP